MLVVYDPALVSYEELLRVDWEEHDPDLGDAAGQRCRHAELGRRLYVADAEQRLTAEASREAYQERLTLAGYGSITTEIRDAGTFYYAEDYHQQYLAKHPEGYCGVGGTGVACPVGLGVGSHASSPPGPS